MFKKAKSNNNFWNYIQPSLFTLLNTAFLHIGLATFTKMILKREIQASLWIEWKEYTKLYLIMPGTSETENQSAFLAFNS